MKKTVLKKDTNANTYWFSSSGAWEAQIIGHTLISSHTKSFIKEWLENNQWLSFEDDRIKLEKRNSEVVFSDLYDDSESKFEFVVSREIFLKILDEWESARAQQKEYIVIEVFDDNQVRIYGTDVVNN